MALPAIGRDLRSFSAFDFRGGLDRKTSPQILATQARFRNRLTQSRNTVYTTAGAVAKRPDAVAYNSVTLGASVRITGGFQFRHSNGNDYNLCGTTDGRVVRLNTDGTTTDLVTGLTSGNSVRWYFTQYNDLAIIANRTDAPRSYDGTTFGALGGTPPSTGGPVATHSNRVLFLDAGDHRRVTWSALNNAEDYTTANNAGSFVVRGRHSSPLVFLLGLTSELLLGHRDFASRLQGASPSTYALTNVLPSAVSQGGISPQGATFANNDGWWISQRGVHQLRTSQDFGDLKENFASALIDPYFTPGSDVTLSLNQLTAAVACYDSQNNRLLFGVDSDGDGQNDTVLCRDLNTGGWSVWDGLSCASLWTAYTGSNGVEVFMGGYDGFVRRLTTSYTNAITGSFKHISDLGMPFWLKHLRHLYVYLREQGAGNVTVTTNFDFGATGGQSYSVSQLGDSDVLGSTFVLGTSTLGARSQIVKRMDTTGLGEFVEIGFSNAQAQPFDVTGYQAMFRPRRTIARAERN